MQDRALKSERIYSGNAALPYALPKEESRAAYSTLPTPSGKTAKYKPDSMNEEPSGAFTVFFTPCKGISPGINAMVVSYQGGGAVQIGSLSCRCDIFVFQLLTLLWGGMCRFALCT